jgi:small subunit ribosomal protein S20
LAHSRSALKRWRQNERRRIRNKAVRSGARTSVKKAITAIEVKAEDASENIREAISALDRAAKKGVIHANNAARRKSRLMARLNAAQGAVGVEKKAPARKRAAAGAKKTAAKKTGASKPRAARTARTKTAKS